LAWSLAILPGLDQDRHGLTALVYDRQYPGGKPQHSLSLTTSHAVLSQPHTSLRAYGFWLPPVAGDYTLRLTCDDAGRLKLDGRTLMRLSGVSAANHDAISLALDAGPHLLEVELVNMPGQGFFRLEVQGPGAKSLSLLEADQLRQVSLGNYDFWAGLASGAEAVRGWGLGGLACLLIVLGLSGLGLPRGMVLWACLAVTLGGGLADVYLERGGPLTEEACRQSTVLGVLRDTERYLRSPAHQQARGKLAGLVLLGDSSHYQHPGTDDHLLYTLRDTVKQRWLNDKVEVYGAAHPGFHAYDFYFLLNHLAPHHPRLVIMPVNVRTFGNISRKYWFDELYGYIQWGELLRPAGLSSASRPMSWSTLLAAKLEASFMTGPGLPFLQVVRNRFKAARDGAEQTYRREIKEFTGRDNWMGPPMDRAHKLGAEWSEITPGHHLLPVYKRINRLAAEAGIGVLYYAVPMNPDTRHLRKGFVDDSYAVLARELREPPHAQFLDLSALPLADDAFVDGLEHFTPGAKRLIARALLEEALPLLAVSPAPAAEPHTEPSSQR
jgi:hypothetical protein